jgi:hypothetical protein
MSARDLAGLPHGSQVQRHDDGSSLVEGLAMVYPMNPCKAVPRPLAILCSLALALALSLAPVTDGTTLALATGSDQFANALAPSLPYGPVDFSTETATTEVGEPQPLCPDGGDAIANTIWFRIDAASDEPFEAATFGSNFDTKIAVWQGTSLADLVPVACAHESGVFGQIVNFDGQAGLSYWIQVGGDPDDPVRLPNGFLEFEMRPEPPVAAMTPLPTSVVSTSVVLHWSATPGAGAITSYDIKYRRAAWNGSFAGWVPLWTGTTATSGTFHGLPGSTYCTTVMAHDSVGGSSFWSGENVCTAVPLDDRSLARSSAWALGTGSAHYLGTYTRASTNGATLTRTHVVARHIDLVAMTCSTCGKVRAYFNGVLVATIDLYSATTVYRKVLPILDSATTLNGTLTIKVAGSGKRVVIDGIGIRRI